jgi:hypothetical protein
MSKVDLSLAKAGDLVHFRCGLTKIINEITMESKGFRCLSFSPKGVKPRIYPNDGNIYVESEYEFDIIKVELK